MNFHFDLAWHFYVVEKGGWSTLRDAINNLACTFSGQLGRAAMSESVSPLAGANQKNGSFNEILGYMRRTAPVWRTELPNTMGMHECTLATVLTALEEEADSRRLAPVAMTAATLRSYLHDMRDRPTDLNAMAADLGVSRATLTRRSRDLLPG